jgi:DME family drug/metabolite transporter
VNRGLLLISLAAVSWGTTGATMTLLAKDAAAGPLLVGFIRMAVAAPCLLVAARLAEGAWRLRRGREGLGCLAAGAAMALYQVFYFRAVTLTGVAVTALLAICSAPLMVAVLGTVSLGERLTARIRIALGLGVLGAGLLLLGPHAIGPVGDSLLLGSALALGAGLSYALYAVVTKAALARVAPLPLAAITFSVAALALAPVVLREPAVARPLAAGWPLFLYLGLVPTALAYMLYTIGLGQTRATVASITTLLEPLTATVLGVVAFGERLGFIGAVGGLLLLAAIVLLAFERGATRSG